MKAVLTKGLTPDERKQLEQEWKAAQPALRVLDRVLADKEAKARKPENTDVVDVGTPYRITEKNGYLRAISEVRTIIEEKE